GISCVDSLTEESFILKAHLLSWSGDIPALSKTLNLSGHNAIKGCRFCQIEGNSSARHVYYPLPIPP
ncbi:2839_t:CDS:1, partial [Diversispora eburnea]